MRPLEKVLDRVEGVEERANGYWCLCPAHNDHNPSLHVEEGEDGRVLMVCRAGCSQAEVLAALEERGLSRRDLFERGSGEVVSLNARPKAQKGSYESGPERLVASWPIKDASGRVVAIHERLERPSGRKRFRWTHPDGRVSRKGEISSTEQPLYGSERVATWPDDRGIVLVEGEKATDALLDLGIRALGTVTGSAVVPAPEALEVLTGRRVVLWPDDDRSGREHMRRVAERLQGIAREVRWFEWEGPAEITGPDAADHPAIVAGDRAGLEELAHELREAPAWEPEEEDTSESLDYPEPGTVDPQDRRGLTVMLAEAIRDRRRFAKDAGGKLYHYEGGVYRPGGDERIAVEVKHLLAENDISAKWSTHRAKEVAEYIRVDAPRLWEQPPRDQVNVLNGILDVETEELTSHTADFLSAVQIPVVYDPAAECPAWDRFISETFPPDARQLAYEIPAWLMTPDTSIQKAILLLGEGANGKSTYLGAVGAFIGRENSAALSLQKIEADRFAAARLVGMLANICPDLPSDHLSSTSTFKAITGGDPISAEYKYGNSFDFRPFARLVFSANHPPRSGDASHAFYRRWLVVPFDQSFEPAQQRPRAELDAELSDPRELSGVLNRALGALRGIRQRGGFSESRSTRDALAEFQKTTDPLSVWLDRNTVEHPDAMVAQDELRKAFNQFAENSGKPGMTPQAFGRALVRVRPGLEKAQRTWRGASNTRVYLGIGLHSEASGDQRVQRDQRDDPNCFKEENGEHTGTEGAVIENNKAQRVDRVEPTEAKGPDTNSQTHRDPEAWGPEAGEDFEDLRGIFGAGEEGDD